MTDSHSTRLILPAMRLRMGDWVYYMAYMKIQDIEARVRVAKEIHKSTRLNDMIQHQLSKRAKDIADYLVNQPQRLFNAFVIGVYGGEPDWYELDVRDRPDLGIGEEELNALNGVIGFLALSGAEKLFAIDGQHRVEGIRVACKQSDSIGREEVAAIFVNHAATEEGLSRTRRLFTTLNRYAKPLNKMEAIALDEDDCVAIETRRLLNEHPLFKERVSTTRSKSLPVNDRGSITSVIALYDALNVYYSDRSARAWNLYKRMRPVSSELERWRARSEQLWHHVSEAIEAVPAYMEDHGQTAASQFRHAAGGHLFFRPIGFEIIVKSIKALEDEGLQTQEAAARIGRLPLELDGRPWRGLLWDSQNQRMITAGVNKRLAIQVMVYAAGGDIARLRTTPDELTSELAGVMQVSPNQIELARL